MAMVFGLVRQSQKGGETGWCRKPGKERIRKKINGGNVFMCIT